MGSDQASQASSLSLRVLTFLLSLASLVLLLKSEQTVRLSTGLQLVDLQVKYSDTSALMFLLSSNGIVAFYCFLQVASSVSGLAGMSSTGKVGWWAIFFLDQALAYVLLAAASSATEVDYLARNGNVKTSWEPLCPTYGFFCRMVRASLVFSFASVLLLAVLSVLSARHLFRHYSRPLFARKHITQT